MEKSEKTLAGIELPVDLQGKSAEELKKISFDIRKFLLRNVSKTGGHLASNLGVVELTIALHRIFNFSKDRLVWDVGHQSYVHKLLTGRKNRFGSLRQTDGMSGFPKTSESVYDSFNTGHSSTSISAALGMARARDLMKDSYSVVAVIGDGAMTGGMAFEALNDAARAKTDLIVVLNDNQMSIEKNVGGMSRYLRKMRIDPLYRRFAKNTETFLSKLPAGGKKITQTVKTTKDFIKRILLNDSIFEQLGFKCFGPIDGHDIPTIEAALNEAKNLHGPVLIHVVTNKGKGYQLAEKFPEKFHGVSSFDTNTGITIKKSTGTFSDEFGKKMIELAEKNDKIVAVTAAMKSGTGLTEFAQKFPGRIYDVGIAEQHAVTMAAGMAMQGLVPVVAIYSTFLQRSYDQILHDVALQNLHIVFAIDRAGVIGEDGETHQGLFDFSYLSHIPNMTILAPCDYDELRTMLGVAVNECKGPVAIRYPRGGSRITLSHQPLLLGKAEIISNGSDITLIAIGSMVETATVIESKMEKSGIEAEVINMRSLKPFDEALVIESARKTNKVVVMEDNTRYGGLSEKVTRTLMDNHFKGDVIFCAYPDSPIEHGDKESIVKRYELDSASIYRRIMVKWGEQFAKGKT